MFLSVLKYFFFLRKIPKIFHPTALTTPTHAWYGIPNVNTPTHGTTNQWSNTMISWTDERGLEAVEARYGARAAQHIPVYGPIVLTHMIALEEPFRSINIVWLMQQTECPRFSEKKCHDIVMQVIRYVNASDAGYYIQQRRVQKSYMWFLFNPGPDKSIFREQDTMFAQKSRVYVERPVTIIRQEVDRQTGNNVSVNLSRPKPTIQQPTENIMTQAHIEQIRAGLTPFMQKINCPFGHIKSADQALKMYDAAVVDKFIDEDDLTIYDADQLKAGLKIIFNL